MKFRAFLLFFFVIVALNFAAIKIKPINRVFNEKLSANEFFPSATRKQIDLSHGWTVYSPENPAKKIKLDIPALFSEGNSLIFTNEFILTQTQIDNFDVYVHFEGIENFAEVSINEQGVIKRPNSAIPFTINIPSEILLPNEPNKLKIKVTSELTSYSTIPQLQRFLFPEHFGGVLGNIYIELIPKNRISSVDYDFSLFKKRKKTYASIVFNTKTVTETSGKFTLKLTLFNDSLKAVASASAVSNLSSPSARIEVKLHNPVLWTQKNPKLYYAKISFFAGDTLLDEIALDVPLLKISKGKSGELQLNGIPLKFHGVTYVPFSAASNPDFSYDVIKRDLKLAKNLGFNFIRFPNQIPDEKIVEMCAKEGLLVSVEVPINFLPSSLWEDEIFNKTLLDFSKELVAEYSKFYNVILFGAGNSLVPDNENHIAYINKFAEIVKNNSDKFSFASFVGFPNEKTNVDFVNVELYSKIKANETLNFLAKSKNLFLTGTYPAFLGSKSGSIVKNSFEAQGAFFKKLLGFSVQNNLPGVFVNTLVDYSGDYNSLYVSYSENHLYKIGVCGIDRKANRTVYNVVREKLKHGKNIVIPLGVRKTDLPLMFIVIPLFLAALIAFVINSRRKFREDASRALLRSYNFFSDIRDMRLLSGFHSYFMFVVNAATMALLVLNILYFLRANIILDKIIVSFGSPSLSDFTAFLAWKPLGSFLALFLIFIGFTLFIVILLKFLAIFNPTKVLFSNIFYTVVWAFMPINLLIPAELVLLKVLALNVANLWIYILLILYLAWLVLRLLKGVYVVFDILPSTVYAFAGGLTVLVLGGILLYVQLSVNGLDYLANAISQIKYF